MTTSPLGAAVDTLGKRLQGRCPPVGPRASLRATPRPRLLHHASGRRPNMFHMWLQADGNIVDFTCNDWRTSPIEALPPDSRYFEAGGNLPPISWTVEPPEYVWRPVEELTAPWKPAGTPELGVMWYHEGVSPGGNSREDVQRYFDDAGRHFAPQVHLLWPAVREALPPPLPRA